MHKMEEDQGARLVRAMANVLLGGVISLVACMVFLFICSVAISNGWIQYGLMYQMSIVGCVVGSFIGGLFAVRRCASRALVVGLATGGVLFLLQLTSGVLFYPEMSLEFGGLGLLCGGLCGGAAAGILGAGPKKRRHKK